MQTRRDTAISFIGNYQPQIIGSKLPSNGDVLRVLFFNIHEVGLRDISQSARLVINEVLNFWNKARIPTKDFYDCIKKLVQLHTEHRNLKRNERRNFPSDIQNRQTFIDGLDDLFDLAHADALKEDTVNYVRNEEDRQFLIGQKKKGPEGFMFGIDWQLYRKELRAAERERVLLERKRKNDESLQKLEEACILEDSGPSSEDENMLMVPSTSKRATQCIMTHKVVAALDKSQLSDRNALHVIAAIVEALGLDPRKFSLNRTSLQRMRNQMRSERANKLKKHFEGLDLIAATIHWDGKLFTSAIDHEKYDRLAIVVTCGKVEKLLCIPEIETSTGRDQAEAIFEVLLDAGVDAKIKALCCDTTNSNLGRRKGAAVLLEFMLSNDLLYFPCRHHIFEIVLAGVFKVKMLPSKGPEILIFKRFKNAWPKIDQNSFKTAIEDPTLSASLEEHRTSILNFTEVVLNLKKQPRNDYQEFLILTQIFLGKVDRHKKFFPPGAIHHARWMAKAIYCLKIFLFRDQFEFQSDEKNGIESLCVFIVTIYVKAWFVTSLPIKAPNHDLEFMKKLLQYESVDSVIAKAAQSKFINHLWYLIPECAAFSFFDNEVSDDCKIKMVSALEQDGIFDDEKRYRFKNFKDVANKEMSDFVSSRSKNFFDRFSLSTDFLNSHPNTWLKNESYQKSLKIVKRIKCVNDVAERAIKLISEYNETLTKTEEQRQNILQIVSNYRQNFPDVKKETLWKKLE